MVSLSFDSRAPRRAPAASPYHATEADLHLYRRVTLALGVPPNSAMLRYAGPEAAHLVFIGESGRGDWARLLREVDARWPDLPPRGPTASDGAVLESLPERVAYEHLRPLMMQGLRLDLNQPISPEHGAYRADLTIRFGRSATYFEVVGACGSDRIVLNRWERRGVARLDRRLKFYARLGITPRCLYLDHLMDADGLKRTYRAAIASLRKAARS